MPSTAQTAVRSLVNPRYRRRGRLLHMVTAALLAATLGSAHAALFGDDEARRAILDLRGKVDANQRDLLRRLERIDQLEQSINASRDRFETSASTNTRAQVDLAGQIELLRQELAQLRGELETLVNEVANTQKRQRDFYVDLDARIRKLEPQQQTVDGKAALIDQSESRSFEAALSAFRSSEFKDAVFAFNNFLRQYPKSPFAPAAQYWLGTSYYALRDYKAAIAAQQIVLRNWPESPRAPDAMLNIASSEMDMGDKPAARATLGRIIATYPNTPTATTARARLAGID